MAKCQICGREIINGGIKYCSKKCQNDANKMKAIEAYNRKHEVFKKTCPCCGKEFETRSSIKKYCSDYCRDENKRQKQKINRENKLNRKVICKWCGKPFVREQGGQKYCSEECSKKAKHERNSEYISRMKYGLIKTKKMGNPEKTIDQVLGEAKEYHMTYGQYVGLLALKAIGENVDFERVLKMEKVMQ